MSGESLLETAIETTFWSLLSDIHTFLPGWIHKFDGKRAEVKPLIKKKYLDDGLKPLPIISNVPVIYQRSKLAGITFPLNKGDGVLIGFCERSLEKWLSSGEDSDPGDRRKFALADAVAIPGLFSFAEESLANFKNDLEIQNRGGRIALGSNTKTTIYNIDGLVTGKSINPFSGLPYSQLPGPNAEGKNISLKVRVEL